MALKVGELYASFGIDSSDLGKALSGIEKQCEQAAKTLAKTGAGLTLAVTTPLVALGKDILQSSIDFESAFAGVIKTVDSDALAAAGMTFDDLADSIRKMSLAAPQTTEALSGIMEAGGQLGIQVTALSEFTETIAALGVATNMTTDEAASMFAKFANITGMDQSEFDSLGSTIVALGNNFATTENDIMSMAMRMASAGTTIGMAETDILAFASAMSSVGIMAEVGGSSFSTFASNLSLAVATSSADLETYASVAGMTADEFATAFGQDATSAMVAFISGLNDVERNGMSAIQLLDQLGITEVGQRNMLLSLANSGTLLAEAITMSSNAWEDNIALLKEAQTRYGTTESQIQIMKNAMELIKIDLGDFALPYIKDLTADVVGATEAFLAMDDSTKMAGIKLAAVAAAAGPVLTALGGIVGAVGNLVPMMGALISPLGLVGAGFALFAVAAVDANNDISRSFESLSKIAQKSLASGNKSLATTMKKVSSRIPALASSIVNVIGNTVPGVIELGFTAVTGFSEAISDNADVIANVGMTMVEKICSGLTDGIPRLIPSAARIVTSISSSLITNLPRLVSSIGEIAGSIWQGLKDVDWFALGVQLVTSIGTALSGIVDVVSGWFSSAKSAVQELTWSDIGESIKSGITISSDWLKNLIAGDAGSDTATWSSIGSSIWSSIKSGITASGDWLAGLIMPEGTTFEAGTGWSSIGKSIWEAIKGGVSATGDWLSCLIMPANTTFTAGAGWKTIGASVWTAIQGGISATGDWLAALIMPANTTFTAGTGWSTIGKAIWTAIQGGISATGDWVKSLILGTSYTADAGWSTVGSAIWTSIKSGISATGDWVKGLVLGAEYTADADWSTIGSAIWSKIQTGITATGDWIKSLILGNAFSADSDWTDVGEKIVSMISSGLSGLDFSAEAMADNLTSLGDFVQTFVQNMLEKKVEIGSSITTFVTNLVSEIANFDGWTSLGDTFGTIATSIVDGIVAAIPTVANGAAAFITSIGSMLESPTAENFLAAATNVATSIIDSIARGIPNVVGGAKSIVGSIGALLSGIDWDLALDSVTAIGTSFLNAIVAAIGSIGNFGESVVGAIGTALTNINWNELSVSLDGFATMLSNGISEGISKAANAASNIVDAVGNLLGSVDWSEFDDAAQQVGSTLISGMVQGLKSLTNGSSQIVSAISELIQNIDWNEAASDAADIAESLFTGLLEGAATITPDVSELLSAIGRGISAAGDGLGRAAGTIIEKIVTAILTPDNWVKLVKAGGEIVRGLGEGIINLGAGILSGAWSFVEETLKGLFRALGFEFEEWSDETEAVISQTVTIINDSGESIYTSLENAAAQMSTLNWRGHMNTEELEMAMQAWDYIVTNGTEEFIASYSEFAFLGCQEITNLFKILCDETEEAANRAAAMIALNDLGLSEFVNASVAACEFDSVIVAKARELSMQGVSTFEDAFAALGITIPEAVQAGIDEGLPFIEAATAAATAAASTENQQAEAEATAVETGTAITSGLASAEEAGCSNVQRATGEVVDVVEVAMNTLPDVAEILGEESSAGLGTGIKNGETVVTDAMAEVSNAAVESFLKEMSYDTGYELGQEYTKGIQQGASSQKTTVTAVMATIASGIRSTVSAILSKSIGIGIGYQFSSGIATGIRNAIGLITSAATDASQAAVTASTETLDIHSPSRVGEKEVGKLYDAGIARGILRNYWMIGDAASNVANDMHDSFMVGDPSRGTVYSSKKTVHQTAKETAAQTAEDKTLLDRAKVMGIAIAEELINSGALEGDFIVDGEATGRRVAGSVSRKINRDSKKTVSGRTGKAVFA